MSTRTRADEMMEMYAQRLRAELAAREIVVSLADNLPTIAGKLWTTDSQTLIDCQTSAEESMGRWYQEVFRDEPDVEILEAFQDLRREWGY